MMIDAVRLLLAVEAYFLIYFLDFKGITALQCYTCNHHETDQKYVLSRGIRGTASSKYCDDPSANKSMLTTCFVPVGTDPRYRCTAYVAKHPTENFRVIVRECVPSNPAFVQAIHIHCNIPSATQQVELNGVKFNAVAKCCDTDGCNVERKSFSQSATTPKAESSAPMSIYISLTTLSYAFVFACLFLL